MDIIITDVYMEDSTAGIDLVKNNVNKNIYFIVCSAFEENYNFLLNNKFNEQINFLSKNSSGNFLDHLSLIIKNILQYKNKEFFLKLPTSLQSKIVIEPSILDLKSVDNVAICFIDIMSSTKLGNILRMKESYFVNFLTDYYNMILEKTNIFGGIVDKFMGDGALIHFGAYDNFDASENAEQCVKCATEIIKNYNNILEKHFEDWRKKFRMPDSSINSYKLKISMNIGTIFRGIIPTSSEVHVTILGDEVNYTSKICDIIDEPSSILVSGPFRNNLRANKLYSFTPIQNGDEEYHKLI